MFLAAPQVVYIGDGAGYIHPSTMSVVHSIYIFWHPIITKVLVFPTFRAITYILLNMNTNAASIHLEFVGVNHVLFSLTFSSTEYATLSAMILSP